MRAAGGCLVLGRPEGCRSPVPVVRVDQLETLHPKSRALLGETGSGAMVRAGGAMGRSHSSQGSSPHPRLGSRREGERPHFKRTKSEKAGPEAWGMGGVPGSVHRGWDPGFKMGGLGGCLRQRLGGKNGTGEDTGSQGFGDLLGDGVLMAPGSHGGEDMEGGWGTGGGSSGFSWGSEGGRCLGTQGRGRWGVWGKSGAGLGAQP